MREDLQYAKNVATLKKCQQHFDAMTPDDPSDDECPECGSAIRVDGDGVKCTDDDCDWSAYPDYDDREA